MVNQLRDRLTAIERRVKWEAWRVLHAAGAYCTGLLATIVIIAALDLFHLVPSRDRLKDDIVLTQRQVDDLTRHAMTKAEKPAFPSGHASTAVANNAGRRLDGRTTPEALHAVLQAHAVDVRETTYDFTASATRTAQAGPTDVHMTMPLVGDYPAVRAALQALSDMPGTRLIDIAIIRSHTTEVRLAVQLHLAYTPAAQS